MSRKLCFLAILLLASGVCEPAHHHQEGAHVHGMLQLNIALEGSREFAAELHGPAESLYGFEYAARSEADVQARDRALSRLRTEFAALLGVDPAARCAAIDSDVEVHGADDHDRHEATSAQPGAHREVHVEYYFRCETPVAGVAVLKPTLHEAFPGIETIQVRILGENRQDSAAITRDHARDARIQL
jgi:hypothetical protein